MQRRKEDRVTDGIDDVTAAVQAFRAFVQTKTAQFTPVVCQRPDTGPLHTANIGCRLGQDAEHHIQTGFCEIGAARQAGNALLKVFRRHQGVGCDEAELCFHVTETALWPYGRFDSLNANDDPGQMPVNSSTPRESNTGLTIARPDPASS
ncbi:hypothetical protein SDC9_193483 [bioreactor metagenome]|uniref:Uncharacterized protein n=1 Tax=bioreactor metagenome TaxID=1076179 RepID=A0A645IC84_9ZZZZ